MKNEQESLEYMLQCHISNVFISAFSLPGHILKAVSS